jgi:hypothetical protein
MMKYVFILVLGLVAATAGLMGLVVALRFVDNMTQTPVITTGERVFPMPTGVVARGGTLILPREQREVAAKIANPLKPTPSRSAGSVTSRSARRATVRS